MIRPTYITAIAAALNAVAWLQAAEPAWPKTRPVDAKYTCAMEEHPDEADPANRGPYWSSEPGKCPLCDMKLKPIESYAWTAKYPPSASHGTSQPPATRPAEQAPASRPPSHGGHTHDASVPADMRYACPMERHPDEKKPDARGPYFSAEPGDCPRCGMALKLAETLSWTATWRAAEGSQVAYTCPQHPHVFAREDGTCPRCGHDLEPFKVMYTCANPKHAGVISRVPGRCAHDGHELVPFRGIWLSEAMARANAPSITQPAEKAAYRCPMHPLVHSDTPGACTICAMPLEPAQLSVAKLKDTAQTRPAPGEFVCPMHPNVKSTRPATCSVCAMQLVPAASLQPAPSAPQRIQRELDNLLEHYLAVQKLLASDSTTGLAQHALGLTAASEQMLKQLDDSDLDAKQQIRIAAARLHEAALKMRGERIADDRVQLVDVSAGMTGLLQHLRPDRNRWPDLYVFHCPMSKGDWIQTSEQKANPYYGFQMLNCGELKEKR